MFSLQCGRNQQVLQETYSLAERAVSLDNNNADYVTELAYELLLQGKTRDALKCSGVPKAGAPDFMSTLEVKVP